MKIILLDHIKKGKTLEQIFLTAGVVQIQEYTICSKEQTGNQENTKER